MNNDICNAFRKNSDGSWSSIASVTINGPNGQIQINAGMTFTHAVQFMGVNLAAWLDQNCPQGGTGL